MSANKPIKPVYSTVPTLENFELEWIEMVCSDCGRRGRYNRDRARAEHGLQMTLNQFMRMKANCTRDTDPLRPCGVGCPDLAYMYQSAPFSDGP